MAWSIRAPYKQPKQVASPDGAVSVYSCCAWGATEGFWGSRNPCPPLRKHEAILQSYFILAFALYTAEASLRAAAVGTTPSSPLQRRAKQSHGSLGSSFTRTRGDPEESWIFNCVLASFTPLFLIWNMLNLKNVRHLGISPYTWVACGVRCSLAASRLDMLLVVLSI